MKRFFHQKILTPFLAVLLAAVCIGGTVCFMHRWEGERRDAVSVRERTEEQLYADAVLDAVVAGEDEIFPLVTLVPDSDAVTFRDGKVLMMTVNSHPERYPAGETVSLPEEVWTVADRELEDWYHAHKDGVTDWTMRLKQLVGVPPKEEYTHVTAMWVRPEDIRRPAYSTDVTDASMVTSLPEGVPDEYREWFNGNIIWSYFESAYPWTRLGYTYDWAEGSGEYGLTEFWVRPGAGATIEYTDTIREFIGRMEDHKRG